MTFLRERKGTTVVVACHEEKERETLNVNESENVIETTIGNQIHLVTDNSGGEMIIVNAFFFSLFFFHGIVQSFNYCTYL